MGSSGPKPAATKDGGGTGEQGPAGEEGIGREHAEVEGGCGSWRMKAMRKEEKKGKERIGPGT